MIAWCPLCKSAPPTARHLGGKRYEPLPSHKRVCACGSSRLIDGELYVKLAALEQLGVGRRPLADLDNQVGPDAASIRPLLVDVVVLLEKFAADDVSSTGDVAELLGASAAEAIGTPIADKCAPVIAELRKVLG